jgi:hypothetical protein
MGFKVVYDFFRLASGDDMSKIADFMKGYKNTLIWGLFILFLLIVVYGILNKQRVEHKMKLSHDVVCGEMTAIKRDKSAYLLFYQFYYQGKKYTNHVSCLNKTKIMFDMGLKKYL